MDPTGITELEAWPQSWDASAPTHRANSSPYQSNWYTGVMIPLEGKVDLGISKSVLITGAAGFLGVRATRVFRRAGWDVWGLDRRPASVWEGGDGQFITTDLLAPGWEAVLNRCGIVVHLAGRAGARDLDEDKHRRDNLLATEALLRAVAPRPGVRVVFSSSSSVYAARANGPMQEVDICRPLHPYGASKLAAERSIIDQLGERCTVLRLFTVYGPGQRSDMLVASAIRAALTGVPMDVHDEAARRDLTYVDDAVAAIMTAARRPEVRGVINVGGGTEYSVHEILGQVGRQLGREVPTRRVDCSLQLSRTLADLARARALLDYEPRWSLKDGVARQIAQSPDVGKARLRRWL
jgi:nucleoside-diphosphate-sugar epimerase